VDSKSTVLILELLVWTAAATAFLSIYMRQAAQNSGLALAYLGYLWLIHWPAALMYLLPWEGLYPIQWVESGFRQSTFAIVSFTLGYVLAGPRLQRIRVLAPNDGASQFEFRALPLWYMAIGLCCYLILDPALRTYPTVHAIGSAGWQLVTVGVALALWRAWLARNRKTLFLSLAAAAVLPILTAVTTGYMGHGALIFIELLAFLCTFYRPRRVLLLIIGVSVYVGMSFYVTYMRDRETLRKDVWGGSAFSTRLERAQNTLSTFELFDPRNTNHLYQVDRRLDQNFLVGAAVEYIADGSVPYAGGTTIWHAFLALIPRIVWADKPVVAGSMRVVSTYTGIEFETGTSVGMGQVFEFYINFGTVGVILGYIIFGALLHGVDFGASIRLRTGRWRSFAVWYLAGLNLLAVGGSLVDISASVVAAIVNALLVNWLLPRPEPVETLRPPTVPVFARSSVPLSRD